MLGKRLSDTLNIPFYDKEIIALIAKESGFDKIMWHISEKKIQAAYPFTIGRQFTTAINHVTEQTIKITVEQHKIIEQFARQGSCIIVGRCADVVLEAYTPFNIFVYADKKSKLLRCKEYAPADEKLTHTELERKMREIDKSRTAHR